MEALGDAPGGWEPLADDSALAALDEGELGKLLQDVQADLKPELRAILRDFFSDRLSYEQIAARHEIAIGSVGVYLKRGLESLRKLAARHPKLLKEMEHFLR